MKRVCVALLMLGAIGYTGCSSSPDPHKAVSSTLDFSTERLGEAHQIFGYRQNYSLLTVAVEGDGQWRWTTEVRLHDETANCMAENGFETYPPIGFTRDQLTRSFQTPILLPLTVEDALAAGYGDTPTDSVPTLDAGRVPDDPAYAEKNLACARSARDAVFGDFGKYEATRIELENLRVEFFENFWDSDEVQNLIGPWSACMSDGGYSFESPYDSRKAAQAMGVDAGKDVAQADARCRDRNQFDVSLLRLFDAAEANFALEHEELILALEALRPNRS